MPPEAQTELTIAELAVRYLGSPKGTIATRIAHYSLERVKSSLRVLKKSSPIPSPATSARWHSTASRTVWLRLVSSPVRQPPDRRYQAGVQMGRVDGIAAGGSVQAMATVPGLRTGRTEARSRSRWPGDDATVKATLPYLSPIVADMVRFQQATGCRPAEVCRIRPIDLDTSGPTWVYRPAQHKTPWRGHKRIIFIGPRGQDVLAGTC